MSHDIVIRASSTSGYADCQLRAIVQTMPRYLAEHGYRLNASRPHIGALVGSGVHGAGELGLTEKMKGSLTPLSALEDAGIETFRARMDEEAQEDGEVILDEVSGRVDLAEKQIRRMAGRWRIDILSTVRPAAVESRINAGIPGHDGVTLSGQADLLAVAFEEDGSTKLRDLKTGKICKAAVSHAPQLGCYSMLWRTLGHNPASASIDFLQRVKIDKDQPKTVVQDLDIDRCEEIAWSVVNDMASKARILAETGDPSHILTNPSSMLCSGKFCRAHGNKICPATRS